MENLCSAHTLLEMHTLQQGLCPCEVSLSVASAGFMCAACVSIGQMHWLSFTLCKLHWVVAHGVYLDLGSDTKQIALSGDFVQLACWYMAVAVQLA